MAAAAAAGKFADLEEAAGRMSRVTFATMPRAENRRAYEIEYRAYLETVRALPPLGHAPDTGRRNGTYLRH